MTTSPPGQATTTETGNPDRWTVERRYIRDWLTTLDQEHTDAVELAIAQLEQHGPSLDRPSAARIWESSIGNLKELRPTAVGRDIMRILFVFAPDRTGVLLFGGTKGVYRQSNNKGWKRWYKKQAIPAAEVNYQDFLERTGQSDRNSCTPRKNR